MALALLAAPAPAIGDARLEISGTVNASGPSFEVRLDVANRGDARADSLTVQGELLGRTDEARLDDGVGPGETRSLVLRFPAEVPRSGVHALLMLVGYSLPSGVGVSERSFLLLIVGERAPPAVRLFLPPEVPLGDMGRLEVGIESADGTAHRVRLRAATARGLRAEAPAGEIDVPAAGRASASVRLLRGSAPWGASQRVLLIAGTSDEPLERTTVETSLVRVRSDPAWMPRLRRPLLVAAALLLGAAIAAEVLRFRAAA